MDISNREYQHALSLFRRCVEDYHMIGEGDRIAVGLSGGKDSVSMLCLFASLRRFYPVPFELEAITVDMGFAAYDPEPLHALCRTIDVPLTVVKTDIGEVVFDIRKEENPCSLCANMRRGALYSTAKEHRCNKVALGHNQDDAVETFLMSLFLEGRIHCFRPVTYLSRREITSIRPLLYIEEKDLRHLAAKCGFPIVKNPCPANGVTAREDTKTLLRKLQKDYPNVKTLIFGAMQRQPVDGWEVADGSV